MSFPFFSSEEVVQGPGAIAFREKDPSAMTEATRPG